MINFIFKKFPNFPYTVAIAIPSVSWCFLSALFGLFIIIGKANFEATETTNIFIISLISYVGLFGFVALAEWGLLRIFGLKIEKKYAKMLNKNITAGHVSRDLSIQDLKKIFELLVKEPREATSYTIKYIMLVIFFITLTEFIASGTTINIFPIVAGGLVSLLLAVSFTSFFSENSVLPALKECKLLLMEKDVKIEKENYFFLDMGKKFALFLLFPIFIILTILVFFGIFNFYILILLIIGILMAFITSRLISFSIYQTFSDVKSFIKKLPESEKVIFATGGLGEDISELSDSLNSAAEEVYLSRVKLEEGKKALEEKIAERTQELEALTKSLEKQVEEKTKKLQLKVNELEEFHRFTVGRELKMIELKEEIKKLKGRMNPSPPQAAGYPVADGTSSLGGFHPRPKG